MNLLFHIFCGIIDSKGNIKIYIEYDEIGIDSTKFTQNNIKNKYLLDNGMIPARKDKLWGAFDKNGKEIIPFEYDSFGYIATSNKDAINLLIIPEYNMLVAQKNKKYTLINSSGETVVQPVIDDVYMTINSGKKYYYMNVNNQTINIEEWLDSVGVKTSGKQNNSGNQSNSTENTNNTENKNTTENQDDTETSSEGEVDGQTEE